MEFTAAQASRWILWLLSGVGLVAAALGASLVFATPTLTYALTAEQLVVDARLGVIDHSFSVDRARIRDVQPARVHGGERRGGTSVPGLCAGRWSYEDIGAVRQATTCGSRTVLITTDDGLFLISPAEREAFVEALLAPNAASGPADAPPRSFAHAPAAGSGWSGPLRVVVLLPVLLLLGIAPRLLRPLVYRVKDGTLVVPAHFRSVRLPLAGARVRTGQLGGWRLAGSAAPGLYLGSFRDRAGGYHAAASLREGVWVEGARRVFVSPADTEAFVAACVAAGAVVETGPPDRAPGEPPPLA
jgi:hypothetical protein